MDGPSVSWSLLNMLDNKLEEKKLSETINIGSCSQHKSVQQGLNEVLTKL